MSNADIFLDYYNKIDKHLIKSEGSLPQTCYSQKVKQSTNRVVQYYKEELITLGELRNAIVHNPKIGGQPIAEPHPSTVERIRKLYEEITAPPKVFPKFCCNVLGAREEDYINEILIKMKENSFSQFPVYNEQDAVVELINSNTIARWLSNNLDKRGGVLAVNVKVKDLIPEIEHTKNYGFIKKQASIYHAYDMFIECIQKKKRNLDALFITENGKSNKSIIGLITIQDIARTDVFSAHN